MVQKLTTVYFSPTHTTKKILSAITKGLSCENKEEINLALVGDTDILIEEGLVILGVPVYSGRVPVMARRKIEQIRAGNVAVVLVVVFGNRDYEDALMELYDLSLDCGFTPVAAASFIGEHSYSTVHFPIALGRPDAQDLELAVNFGKKIAESSFILLKDVPGNRPYKELKTAMHITPSTDEEKCNGCGICVSVCPTKAISLNGKPETNEENCILCCACIKFCPSDARYNNHENITAIAIRLNEFCAIRKEPVFFLP